MIWMMNGDQCALIISGAGVIWRLKKTTQKMDSEVSTMYTEISFILSPT